jgi:hypothetical protein
MENKIGPEEKEGCSEVKEEDEKETWRKAFASLTTFAFRFV